MTLALEGFSFEDLGAIFLDSEVKGYKTKGLWFPEEEYSGNTGRDPEIEGIMSG